MPDSQPYYAPSISLCITICGGQLHYVKTIAGKVGGRGREGEGREGEGGRRERGRRERGRREGGRREGGRGREKGGREEGREGGREEGREKGGVGRVPMLCSQWPHRGSPHWRVIAHY